MSNETAPHSIHVLLVETDPAIRQLVEYFLVNSGFVCVTATDFERAIDTLIKTPGSIDLLITNVLTGNEDARSIVESYQEKSLDIPVIYTSSESMRELSSGHGIEIPASAFLRKPFSQQQLLAKILVVMTTE